MDSYNANAHFKTKCEDLFISTYKNKQENANFILLHMFILIKENISKIKLQ